MHEDLENGIETRENNWKNKYVAFYQKCPWSGRHLLFIQTLYVPMSMSIGSSSFSITTCWLASYLETGEGNETTNLTSDWKMIMETEWCLSHRNNTGGKLWLHIFTRQAWKMKHTKFAAGCKRKHYVRRIITWEYSQQKDIWSRIRNLDYFIWVI